MRTLNLNGHTLKVYDSIDELPILNFQKYNKYLLIDSGVGSDVDAIDAHIVKIAKYIKAKNEKSALLELQNMRQNIYMVNSQISPKYLAFAALIQSIDGEEIKDLSDENLKAILTKINKVKHSFLVSLLRELKKKITLELEVYFPADFTSVKEKAMYDKLKNRTLLALESLSRGVDNKDQIAILDGAILSFYTPKSFEGASSVEIKYDRQFENTCLLISQKTNMDARKMTVLQYYSAIEDIKKQVEAESKSIKRHKK